MKLIVLFVLFTQATAFACGPAPIYDEIKFGLQVYQFGTEVTGLRGILTTASADLLSVLDRLVSQTSAPVILSKKPLKTIDIEIKKMRVTYDRLRLVADTVTMKKDARVALKAMDKSLRELEHYVSSFMGC